MRNKKIKKYRIIRNIKQRLRKVGNKSKSTMRIIQLTWLSTLGGCTQIQIFFQVKAISHNKDAAYL